MADIESYLIIFNIAKNSNFGFLIRTAEAFGTTPIIVGRKHFSRRGATAGTRRTRMLRFYSLQEACDFVRQRGCQVCGVEIDPAADAIGEANFQGPTAFMMGNEGEGLTEPQRQFCDRLVYIPQFGVAVSLNVNVAAGIVLHHFARWAGYEETMRIENQYRAENLAIYGANKSQDSNDGVE